MCTYFRASKRKRKGGDDKTAASKDGKKSQAAGQAKDSKSTERVATQLKSQEGKKHDSEHAVGKTASNVDRPESHTRDSDRGESAADPDGKYVNVLGLVHTQ